MNMPPDVLSAVRSSALALSSPTDDVDEIVERVAGVSYVLLGEATHGTHEFYRMRAQITRALVERHGFAAVVVEADWPDAYRVNRWVRGTGADASPDEALQGFGRFPTWMWRNRDIVDLVTWLREWNVRRPAEQRAGFYGMDLYSLHTSIAVVLEYLGKIDPDGARRARYRYSCFDHFGDDAQAYGYATSFGLSRGCEEEVVEQLVELRRRAADYAMAGRQCPSASPRIRGPSRPPPTGMGRPNENRSCRRSKTATSGCCTTQASPISSCRSTSRPSMTRCWHRASSAPSESFTCRAANA